MRKLVTVLLATAAVAALAAWPAAASPGLKLDNKGELVASGFGVRFEITFSCSQAVVNGFPLAPTAWLRLIQHQGDDTEGGMSAWIFPTCDGEPHSYTATTAIIAGFGRFVPGKASLEFGCICVVDANRTSREVLVVEPKS